MLRHRLLTGLATAAVLAAGAATADAKTVRIAVKDDVFAPKSKTVAKGTRLKFVWKGKNTHNVKATGAAKKESPFQKSGTFAFKAKRKGTISLICDVHDGMKGTVKVR